MQTNTPTPPPRNRRAGRMSALPPQAPLNPPTQPAAAPQPAPPIPALPQPPATEPPRPVAATSAPAADRLRALHGETPQPRPAAPVKAAPPQPSARVHPSAPAGARNVPAGARPQAAPPTRPVYRDDPLERRAPAPVRPRPVEPPAEKPPEPRRVPGWLRTLLSLLLLGVLALGAYSLLIMADLRTTEKAREQAWNTLLSNHHITVGADGTLQVTWQELIEHYAGMYNLDPAFVTAIIRNESSFRTTAVSSVGARGLMQMMPDTAEWIAGKLDEPFDFDKLFEAETSIRYGCWYLGYLSELFAGNTVLVTAAYHAGQGEVWSWLGNPAVSPDGVNVPIANIPITNTRIYAERVTYAYGIYEELLYPAP